MVFALFITHATGYVEMQTFDTAFDRGVEIIRRRFDSVTFRSVDYAPKGA